MFCISFLLWTGWFACFLDLKVTVSCLLLTLVLFSSNTLAGSQLFDQFGSWNNSGKMLNLYLFSWRELSVIFFFTELFWSGGVEAFWLIVANIHLVWECCLTLAASGKMRSKPKVPKEMPQLMPFPFFFLFFLVRVLPRVVLYDSLYHIKGGKKKMKCLQLQWRRIAPKTSLCFLPQLLLHVGSLVKIASLFWWRIATLDVLCLSVAPWN